VRCNSTTFFTTLKNKNIDFVALAMTPWHAIGIDAFLFEKSKEYHRKVSGLVMIIQNNDKYVLHENNFSCKNFADVDFYYIENLTNQRFMNNIYNVMSEGFNILRGIKNCRNKENNKKRLYLISPWTPYLPFIEYFKDKEISNNYKPIFVVVDEGVGMYFTKKSRWLGLNHESKFSPFGEIKLKSYAYADKFLRKISIRYVPLENRFIYGYGPSFKRNKDIINLYKKMIGLRSNDLGLDEDNVVLMVTQPLSEHKMVSKKQEYCIINEIVQLFNDNNIKLLIKPHPYEAKNKYDYLKNNDVKIITNNFPVEEIIPSLNPLCVIGTTSTALINSKLIFNITAISVVNLLKTDNKLMEYKMQNFKELSIDFINFIDSIDEIVEFLDLNTNLKDKEA
jgi:hypothetical protein